MATEYKVPFGAEIHAELAIQIHDLPGRAEGGLVVGGEDLRDAALDEGYIVEVHEDGEYVEAIVSEDSDLAEKAVADGSARVV